jgi:hypothetical protein
MQTFYSVLATLKTADFTIYIRKAVDTCAESITEKFLVTGPEYLSLM